MLSDSFRTASMLGFIIPIKSRVVARDWTRFSQTVERTLRSACGQTISSFRVLAVCHERPETEFNHASLEFIDVNGQRPTENRGQRIRDKHAKLLAGLEALRETAVTHVMALDSDDLVSNRLARYVSDHRDGNGWFFPNGYVHSDRAPTLHHLRSRFHEWCGSSNILRIDNVEREDVDGPLWRLDHRKIADSQRGKGFPMAPLPFPGTIYNISHGENFNDYYDHFWAGRLVRRVAFRVLFQRRISEGIRREFGLYSLPAPGGLPVNREGSS